MFISFVCSPSVLFSAVSDFSTCLLLSELHCFSKKQTKKTSQRSTFLSSELQILFSKSSSFKCLPLMPHLIFGICKSLSFLHTHLLYLKHVLFLSLSPLSLWYNPAFISFNHFLPLFLLWRSLDLTGPLFLGGVPNVPDNFPFGSREFIGCMKDLHIDNKELDLGGFIANNGTLRGQCWYSHVLP